MPKRGHGGAFRGRERVQVFWFILLAVLAVFGFVAGNWMSRGSRQRTVLVGGGALGLLAIWVWLLHHPAVAVHVLPVSVLAHVEGVGAVPLFMAIVGVAWTNASLPRQRRITILAAFFGGIFFLQGSLWMLQSAPARVLGESSRQTVVMQSQDYTCVPAACATALHRLGVLTSEAEMAELTQTRPGTGSTLIRALDGLRRKLDREMGRIAGVDADESEASIRSVRIAGTLRPELLQPALTELVLLQPPLITPLQAETTQLHMVVILSVDRGSIRIADPELGVIRLSTDEFAQQYTGQVIHFVRR